MVEFIILGMLMEQRMNGYELKKTIDSSTGTFYTASFGSLYPALKRLTDRGMLSVEELEDSKNKKIYALLPAGRDAFLAWLGEPLQLTRNELLSRLFFYDYLDEQTRLMRLTEYQNKLNGELGRLNAIQEIVSGELAQVENPDQYFHRVSVLSFGLNYYTMVNQWIQNIKERNNHS